jgi:hypothetical protein
MPEHSLLFWDKKHLFVDKIGFTAYHDTVDCKNYFTFFEVRMKSSRFRVLWVLLVVGIGISIIPWLSMMKIDAELMEPTPGYGIVDYEFSFTGEKAREIIDTWGEKRLSAAVKSLKIDFLFIPGYVLLFFSLTMLISRIHTGRIEKYGKVVSLLPFISGIFDVIENIFLLSIARSPDVISDMHARVAGISASIKFALLVFVILFWLCAIGAQGVKLFSRKKSRSTG